MKLLADLTVNEIEALLCDQPKYRAKQIFKWVSMGALIDEMSDIPLNIRQRLKIGEALGEADGANTKTTDKPADKGDKPGGFCDSAAQIIKEEPALDGSVKLLYRLWDGNAVEGIYMPHSYGNTLCVSTQVGCKMRCAFCASGLGGLIRNLSAGEIYGQVIVANKRFSGGVSKNNPKDMSGGKCGKNGGDCGEKSERAISKVVFMGSGEPLDNYDAVTKAITLLCDENGLNLSQRGISLSTCGLPDKIRKLADDKFSVTLSISLHATTDEVRATLMPVANSFKIHEVLDAARYYFEKTGRRIAIEYVTIKDKNMTFFDAKRLKELTKGMSAHVNLIPLNYVKESALIPATKPQTERFLARLKELNVSATLRKSAGKSSSGACGQLRNLYIGQKHAVPSDKKP